MAHRVLGHEPEVPGAWVRHPWGWSNLIFPTTKRGGPSGGGHVSFRALLDAQRHAESEAGEDVQEPGNILTLRHILDEHRPEALIAAFVGTHYRSPLEFSAELLQEAEQQVDRLRNMFRALADHAGSSRGPASETAELLTGGVAALMEQRRAAFDEAMADDLNTAAALAEVFGLAREVNAALAAGELSTAAAAEVRRRMEEMVYILGLDAAARVEDSVPDEVTALAEERQAARAAKDFARADELRAAISEKGYEVRDVAGGFKLIPIR